MGPLVFVARSQVRRRWRALLALAIVAGVAGGIACALVAGSRRSASVVDRYFRAAIPYTLTVGGEELSRQALLAMPGVVRADPGAYVGMLVDGSRDGINGLAVDPASQDPTIRLLRGRYLMPAERDAVGLVNQTFVDEFHLGVNDIVDVRMFSHADNDSLSTGEYRATGPRFRFRIVGIVRTPSDVALDQARGPGRSAYGASNGMFIPYGWYEANANSFLTFPTGYDVQLRDPVHDRAPFMEAVRAVNKRGEPAGFGPARFSERRASFDTPVSVETGVLLALGVALALAAAILVTLLLRAEERTHSDEQPVLASLGMTRPGLGAIASLRALPVALGAAFLTVLVGYALSGRFPIGIGHQLELRQGRAANVAVLTVAALATLVVVVGAAFAFGALGRHASRSARTRRTLAARLAGAGAPADVVVGAHLAFGPRTANGGAPARQAVFGGTLALILIASVAIAVAGIDDLYSRPAAHGWPWDAVIGNVNFAMPKPMLARLTTDPRFAGRSRVGYGQVTIGGRSLETVAIDPADTAPPVVLHGRLPVASTEIAVGDKLVNRLHARIGTKVSFSVKDGEFDTGRDTKTLDLTVVGVAISPVLGETEFGEISVVTFDAVRAAGGSTDPRMVLVRFRPGDRAATLRSLQRDYTAEMLSDNVPARITNLHRVRYLPIVGAVIAATFGTVLLGYTLAVGVRVRRRELGVLRAMGMAPSRLVRVLSYQGLMLAVTMLVIGLPLGFLVGAYAWRTIAHQLGVADTPTFTAAMALLIPATIAVGLVMSVAPARRARRLNVAGLLRVE